MMWWLNHWCKLSARLGKCKLPMSGPLQQKLLMLPTIRMYWSSRVGTRISLPKLDKGHSKLEASFISTNSKEVKRLRTITMFVVSAAVVMVGVAYAGVPLYRMFCQSTGMGGEVQKGSYVSKIEMLLPVTDRVIRVRFNADTASSMQWSFRPHQSEIKVMPGETALAFYRAKNPTDVAIVGISTYNVVPFEAGQYFNKIQCFCFEEQRLNPHEEIDMPVFFYIDPDFCIDPKMENVDIITLSYTFFEAKEDMTLPFPKYFASQSQTDISNIS